MFTVTKEQIEYLLNEMNNHDINEAEICVNVNYDEVEDVSLELYKKNVDNKGIIYWKIIEAEKKWKKVLDKALFLLYNKCIKKQRNRGKR